MLRLSAVSLLLFALPSTVCLCQCAFPASPSANLLKYEFEPLLAKDKMALRVTLEFKGGPLGKIKLEDDSEVTGFLCEAHAVEGARDISEFGGWRGWVAAQG